MNDTRRDGVRAGIVNEATNLNASTFGVIFGFGGFWHGFFEALQGNVSVNGPVIFAIGEANRFWEQGTEPAFTVLPTFLAAGFCTMAVALASIVWSAGFLSKKRGPLVFLSLFTLLFLSGGGIGQVPFFTVIAAFATRIRKPLVLWRKLPGKLLRAFGAAWVPSLSLGALLVLFALESAVFGFVPGVSDPDSVSLTMLVSIGAGFAFMIAAFTAGLARDAAKENA